MVTSHDVARVAGVSQSTVSRVLAGKPNVRPATRERVRAALVQTGYSRNALARAMRTNRTDTIGVVIASITNPFYLQIVHQLGQQLSALGLRMTLWDSEGPGEHSAVAAIREGLVDGVVFTTATSDSTALHEAIAVKAPVVLVNRTVADLACDQVTNENHESGRMVADHLLQAGHTSIGLIAGPSAASTSREREAGFRGRLADHRVALPPGLTHRGGFDHDTGYLAMHRWFGPEPHGPRPTAIFCVNDLIAFGALDAARALDVSIPHDLWVVGHDDIEMSAWEAYDLTTVRQHVNDMVATALDLLTARLRDPHRQPEFHRFPCDLVIRRSTDAARPLTSR